MNIQFYKKQMMKRGFFSLWMLLLLSGLLSSTAQAEKGLWERISSLSSSANNTFLQADQAFELLLESTDGRQIQAHWKIAKGYYLYKDKFAFSVQNAELNQENTAAALQLGTAQFPVAEIKDDEAFGRSEVFHKDLTVNVPLQRLNASVSERIKLEVKYQGCADKGFCYPPITKVIDVLIPAAVAANANVVSSASQSDKAVPEQTRLANTIADGSIVAIILTFFGLGLLLSFTPCVFPMIPILSGIIVGQGEKAHQSKHTFLLSLVFVLSMSAAYTLAGIVAGLTGANLQAAFQNPWVISLFSLFFVGLAFSMFGFYELQMPSRLQNRLSAVSHRFKGGQWVGVAAMGLFSALIVGPCVAAPLVGALMYISQSGDALTGGLALFSMSMGMGVPLLALGASAGKLLPRAGGWMDAVKNVFGVLLLGLAIWMLERILPAGVTLLLWAALFVVSAMYLGALEPLSQGKSGWHRLWKGLGVFLLLYGILLMLGALTGGRDVLHPLERSNLLVAAQSGSVVIVDFKKITTLAELEEQISLAGAKGIPVMLDYYADWCVSCKEMERETFNNPVVAKKLQKMLILQADVTTNDDHAKALLTRFGLFGPPSILFFDRQGRELTSFRLVGFLGPEAFSQHLDRVLES